MIQVVFALRFQSQLHRTRPKLLRDLEKSIIETLEGYGSKVRVENKLINGVFSQETLGFWLDMLCVLETIKNILERTATELYGHVCIVGENLPEEDVLFLVRALPTEPWGTGIWCTPGICDALKPFIDFDEALSGDNQPGSGFSQLRAIREWGDTPVLTGEKNHTGKIKGFLKRKPACNTIVVGDEWASYQEELILYCKEHMKGIPPLIIRLKKGKNSITCLIDALTPEIKTLLEMEDQLDPETRNRLAELEKTLFKERLRDELSEFTIKQGELFFTLLLGLYRTAVEKKSAKPVIILENLQDADPGSRAIIAGSYFAYPAKERITIYGTSASLKALKPWEELFSRIIKFTSEEAVQEPEIKIDLPRDLWEIWYCSVLFKRFFPPFLIPQLLQEEGKNPVMIEKSLEILSRLHIPKQGNFINQAETALGKEAVSVRSVVHRRLLAWVKDFRLKPCFPLLVALADLGSLEDDNLILDTICADIVNGTFSGIERAIQTKTFSAVTGKDKENALLLIVKTQKALTHGGNEEIKNAFSDFSLAEKSGSPCIRSGIAA
ncbi:MAG: hypothetical protein LBH07_01750, partial [Treponema sp.]|nr:hypothetical protein [Treponema sp.]